MTCIDELKIRTWNREELEQDDTVIRAICDDKLYNPGIGPDAMGLLGSALLYHNEAHIHFDLSAVAEVNGQNVGVAVINIDSPPSVHMYVHRAWRRKGIGRALLAALSGKRSLREPLHFGLYTGLSDGLYRSFGIIGQRDSIDWTWEGAANNVVSANEPINLRVSFDYAQEW